MFTLPDLPYDFGALEPYIDARTMEIHHGKHHKAYVDNLNKALEGAPALQGRTIEEIVRNLASAPEEVRTAIRNNGGGHYKTASSGRSCLPKAAESPQGCSSTRSTKLSGVL